MALKPGSNESESPADEALTEDDRLAPAGDPASDRNAEAEQETPTPADPPDPAEGTETEKPDGATPAKPTPSKPSPVDEAIERLTAPTEETDEPKPGAGKATEGKPAKPAGAAAPTDPLATGDDQQNGDEKAKKDALDDWTPEERKNTKGKVKERYRKLHDEHEQAKPLVEVGRGWSEFATKHQLGPDLQEFGDNADALAVAIRTQAATLRVASAAREKREVSAADVKWLQRNREAIDQVLGMAGHKAPTAAPAEDLSKVEITQEVRDLQDAFGVLKSEDELRAVQAALNRVRAPKGKPAAKAAEEQVIPDQPPAKPAAPARSVPWTAHDEHLVKESIREDLVKAGIARDRIAGHYAANISPLLSKRLTALYPGQDPNAAWENLSPSSRRELVAQAHSAWAASQAKPATPRAPARAPTPQPVQGTGSRPALVRAATNGKGSVSAVIDAMCVGEGD